MRRPFPYQKKMWFFRLFSCEEGDKTNNFEVGCVSQLKTILSEGQFAVENRIPITRLRPEVDVVDVVAKPLFQTIF